MDNPFNTYSYGCGYSSVATNKYNPYNTRNTTTTGYNVQTNRSTI